MADQFPDGVSFVSLAPVFDPRAVGSAVAQALGVPGVGQGPWAERLTAFLGDRHLLLLLDNFEQVDEAASLLVELLATCSNLQILVTSRGPLRVSGERLFPVPLLALVHPEKADSAVDIPQSDAIRLFVDRAQAVDPNFVLTPETARLWWRFAGAWTVCRSPLSWPLPG